MPVYNGGDDLRHAIDSILAQTHAEFELIISDNASTDGTTKALTEEYARRDSRIRLTRQPVNRGALANFLWVFDQARGGYFMWAAHDDRWSSNYIESLARRLDEVPEAALATPVTRMEKATSDGDTELKIFPPAPNGDRWETIDTFLNMTGVWIYGLYRTDCLKRTLPEWSRYQFGHGDHIWLYDLLLRERVVGESAATYYRGHSRGKYKLTQRRKVQTAAAVIYHILRLTWVRVPASERWTGLRRALQFIYRRQIWQSTPLGTLCRIVKLTVLGAWFGLEAGARRLVGLRGSTS
jgi:glycosyltransferase involved in cell wall biosynthesis